jgi:hypothetical protein
MVSAVDSEIEHRRLELSRIEVGGILVQGARQKLAHVDVTPNATLNSLRRDGQMAKEKLS